MSKKSRKKIKKILKAALALAGGAAMLGSS